MSKKLPESIGRLVEMGRISAPFGIKGWVRVTPFTASANGLTNYPMWWLGGAGHWREYEITHSQVQGGDVIAKLAGCDDRDAAAAMKGLPVAVPRESFPQAAKGEYYWADLIGLRVRNTEGLDFGVVAEMLETGANDVMVVQQGAVDGDKEQERLIPFIADVIKRVDIAAGVIDVEWGADY